MKIDTQFVREVLDACEAALTHRGFARLRRDNIVFPVSDDFLGWTGLNVGRHEGYVRINPFVGVHCVPLMKLVADLSGEKYQKGRYATFAVHMGELCPDQDAFDFRAPTEVAPKANRLAATYEECGVPFMAQHSSFDTLLPPLESRISLFGGFPQRYAAALYLSGQHDKARQFVAEKVEEYEGESAIVRESFNRFAKQFLRLTAH